MITLLPLALLLLTGFFIFLNARKTAIALWLVVIIIFWPIIGTGLLASLLLKPLQEHYTYFATPDWGARNIIVVLGAQSVTSPKKAIIPQVIAYSRIYEAARLYMSCKKATKECVIITSGGDPRNKGRSEADIYQEYLINLGVNPKDIIKETHSNNTFQNAEFTKAILVTRKFDKLFLVTSGIHLKRSMLYFSHFDVNPIAMPADYIAISKSFFPNGYNFAITDYAAHEYIGIGRYYFYNFMGWNKPEK